MLNLKNQTHGRARAAQCTDPGRARRRGTEPQLVYDGTHGSVSGNGRQRRCSRSS